MLVSSFENGKREPQQTQPWVYSQVQLQQIATEMNVRGLHFYYYFCSKMLHLSKPASKLWPFSEVKDKDFVCIGIKKTKGKKKERLLIPYRNTSISKLTLGIMCTPPGDQDLP